MVSGAPIAVSSPGGTDALTGRLKGWSAGPGALYRKLAAALARLVEEGSLAKGERLPSERVLATALGISRTTVVAAYNELRAAGVLDGRKGSGARVDRHR
ncbi:hypothetical protein Nans01_21580 [Nocardiopsis ansamitocini]|uniref:HTH gntR-type domain-containing protein n=2 Tax=Nocardiopsis ansamitocini TaxID=1670832 RepID=A0A9W6UIK9_9ACTN|nr:hypothetical protein Nans01_21580 [Nocardiopsis ansamitocini]